MTEVFVRLYLDEDVHVLVARYLRYRGFDVETARDAGLLRASDERQLEHAASVGRALVTHNRRDFERLATQWFHGQRNHSGIIIAVQRMPLQTVDTLLRVLNLYTADEIVDLVLYI